MGVFPRAFCRRCEDRSDDAIHRRMLDCAAMLAMTVAFV